MGHGTVACAPWLVGAEVPGWLENNESILLVRDL